MDEHRSPKLRRIERDAELTIRGLEARGELRGVAGQGAPLPDDDRGPVDSWAARRIMRSAGAVPEWADLRKDIAGRTATLRLRVRAHRQWLHDRARLLAEVPAERVVESVRATAARDQRVRGELESALGALNALVRRYDLLVPAAMQLPLVTLESLEGAST